MKVQLNDLYDYIPLKIYQNDDYFKFSMDSVLLAEFVKLTNKTKNILELCSGNCAISMILTTKTKANITSIELQNEIYELAKKSIEYNKLHKQINLINMDLNNYFPGNKFDIIVCNPPYFSKEEKSYVNNDNVKAIARHEIAVSLEDIIRKASSLLDLNGELYMVHRSERLDEIIILCNKYNINVKNLQFITTKDSLSPKIILIRSVKGSSKNIKISPVISVEKLVSFKNMFWKE